MKIVSDLHVHGKYAAACSKDLTLANLEKYARLKGINLLGTGDCLHPKWFEEIKTSLTEDENGILWTKTKFPFVLQTEIALFYTQGEKGRRIHYIVLIPNLEVLNQVVSELKKKYRLDYDGRPIFGMSSIEFVERMMSISKDIEIIPAHAWTSWMGIFGSKSGFDSLEECFEDKTKYIHAIETGLSSNSPMNWRIKFLDNITLVSFSDLHSYWPWRLGREATIFGLSKLTYQNIIESIRKRAILETLEFFPEQGKYHYDGHRVCNVSMGPKETKKCKGVCPKCGKEMTIGVLNRVEELADRPEGYTPKGATPFKSLIPLSEIVSISINSAVFSKKVFEMYNSLIDRFDNELNVLLNVTREELVKVTSEKIADAIIKVREGKVRFDAGYDGVYGIPIFNDSKIKQTYIDQKSLTEF